MSRPLTSEGEEWAQEEEGYPEGMMDEGESGSAEEAKGAFAWLLRRRWGITALRENARLRLDRHDHLNTTYQLLLRHVCTR